MGGINAEYFFLFFFFNFRDVPFHVFFSILPLVAKRPDELSWNSDPMLSQRLLKTSGPFALVKKASDTRDHPFIESLHNLCARVVILPITMVLVVNPSMEINSKMKIFN